MQIALITDPIDPAAITRLQQVAEVRLLADAQVGSLEEEIGTANIVIVRRPISAALLPGAPSLRALIRHGVGLDFIPVDAASAAGIAVTNTPDTNAQSVAEHVFGMVLALQRRIARHDPLIRAGEWHALRADAPLLREIASTTLGIIGFGSIGKAVARIGHFGFGMHVMAARRTPCETPEWVEHSSIEEIASVAQVLVIACPLTHKTEGMIDAQLIGSMSPDAIIVNIARGSIIDEAALAAALDERRIAGAALDVFSQQPLPPNSPLLSCANVLLSPHTAGITRESMRRMSDVAVSDALQVLRGERPRNLVNTDAWQQIAGRWKQLPGEIKSPGKS